MDACLIDAHIDGIDLKGADVSGATYDVEQLVATGVLEGAVVGAVDWCNKSLQNAKLHSVMLSLALSCSVPWSCPKQLLEALSVGLGLKSGLGSGQLSLSLFVMMRSKEFKISRFFLMLIL